MLSLYDEWNISLRDEEPQKNYYVVSWRYEDAEGIIDDADVFKAYDEDDARIQFLVMKDKDDQIPDESEIISIEIA